MNKQKNYRRRQRGITPITTPRNSPGVAQFSMSEVAQFSVSLDTAQHLAAGDRRSRATAVQGEDRLSAFPGRNRQQSSEGPSR